MSKSIFYDHTKHLYLSWITTRGSNNTNKGIFKEFCYKIWLFMILKRIQFMKYLHMHVIIYMRLISKKKHMLSFVLVKAFCIFPLWYFSKKTRSCKIEICYSFRDNGINVSLLCTLTFQVSIYVIIGFRNEPNNTSNKMQILRVRVLKNYSTNGIW